MQITCNYTSKLSPSTCLGLCCFLKIILDFNITDLLSVINFSNCTRGTGLLSKISVSELYRNPTLMGQTHIQKPLKVNPKSVDILKIWARPSYIICKLRFQAEQHYYGISCLPTRLLQVLYLDINVGHWKKLIPGEDTKLSEKDKDANHKHIL